ncbi:MAG TPA: hypothetical protein DCR40_06550 [Prolixibacteraceae bacterium]|nr:hypothetical protein [Prolixibacteraceae bacterium]
MGKKVVAFCDMPGLSNKFPFPNIKICINILVYNMPFVKSYFQTIEKTLPNPVRFSKPDRIKCLMLASVRMNRDIYFFDQFYNQFVVAFWQMFAAASIS